MISVGDRLGPFFLESKLGQGAMGSVFRGRHEKSNKTVAVKVMLDHEAKNPNIVARFKREIKLLSQFHHANIVKIFGESEDRGVHYYAMELVEGRTLDDVLRERGKLSLARTISYTVQICDALQEIHQVGVVHRDLKPANIMISNDHRVKLTDFGIAKDTSAVHETQLTRADQAVGTVAYMSPEQMANEEIRGKSDLYSLGLMVYRMLTGRLPFQADTIFDLVNARMQGKFVPASAVEPDVPVEMDKLLSELMHRDPDKRPRDAYMVMQRLLDVAKRAKEGTLVKTKTDETNQALQETVVIEARKPTLFSSFSGSSKSLWGTLTGRGFSVKSKAGKKRIDVEAPDRSTWIAGAVLVVIAGVLLYTFVLPPSAARMLAQAKQKFGVDSVGMDWKAGVAVLEQLVARHSTGPAVDEAKTLLAEYRDRKIPLDDARAKMNRASRNINVPDPTPGFLEMKRALESKDAEVKHDQLRSIIAAYETDAKEWVWAELAKGKITELFADEAQRVALVRSFIDAQLAAAEKLRGDPAKLSEVVAVYQRIVRNYQSKTDEVILTRCKAAQQELDRISTAVKGASPPPPADETGDERKKEAAEPQP